MTKLYDGKASREEIDGWLVRQNMRYFYLQDLFLPLISLIILLIRHRERLQIEFKIILAGLIMIMSALII